MKMHSRIHTLRAAFAILFLVAFTNALGETNDAAIARNREAIRSVIAKESVPAISVSVVKNGTVVWTEAFGLANIEANSAATPDTMFGIGSISKSLTMVLAVKLAEEGLLDHDAPIEKYLPDFPHKNQGVTIRLIGQHLSGYADDFDNDNFYNTKRHESTDESLKAFYPEKLAAKPGERTIYGTTTFTLVAGAIEKATKRDFVTAINDFVLKPLQLKNTVPNDKRRIIPNRTAFYIRDPSGNTVNGEYTDPRFQKPMSYYCQQMEADEGSVIVKGKSLDDDAVAAVAKSTAATGNTASALIQVEKGSRPIPISFKGDARRVVIDSEVEKAEALALIQREYSEVRQ